MTPAPPSNSGRTLAGTWTLWALVILIVALKMFAARASGSVAALTALTDSLIDLVALGLVASGASRTFASEAPLRRLKGSMVIAAGAAMALVCLWRLTQPAPLSGGLWGPLAALAVLILTVGLGYLRSRAVAGSTQEARSAARDQSLAETAAAGVLVLGLGAGVLLGAPALDSAAGLILAIWMSWGGWTLIRTASGHEAAVGPALTPGLPPARRGPWG